jgi:hypothetical protein
VADHRSTSPYSGDLARLDRMPTYSHPAESATDGTTHQPRAATKKPTVRIRPALLLAGLMTSSALAATSLIVCAVVVRSLLGDRSSLLSTVLIASGTLALTCVGSWWSQPRVTRLVTRWLSTR